MGKVSLKQAQEVMAKAGTNCDWEAVMSEQAQEAIKDPILFGQEFTHFLQNGGQAMPVTINGIVPPQGGRIHIMSVLVDESRDWEDVVKAVAGDVNPGGYIWLVGDKYPSVSTAELEMRTIFLVNFSQCMSSEDVLSWSRSEHLRPVTPRTVFAVGEHYPNLHAVLGMSRVSVISLEHCLSEGKLCICLVSLRERQSGISLQELASSRKRTDWFAFVRE